MHAEKQNKIMVFHMSIYFQVLGALMWHAVSKEGKVLEWLFSNYIPWSPGVPRDALEGQAKQAGPFQLELLCFCVLCVRF